MCEKMDKLSNLNPKRILTEDYEDTAKTPSSE